MIEEVERAFPLENAEEGDPQGHLTVLGILAMVVRDRRMMLTILGIGTAATLAILLLKERTYTTSFSFAPQASTDFGRGGLATIADQFGLSLGGGGNMAQSPQFYADLLVTREVLAPIARDSFVVSPPGGPKVPLADFLKTSGSNKEEVLDETIRALRKRVISYSVATRTTGVISVAVKTVSPQLSFEIADRIIGGVNQFNLVTRQSQAAAERRFSEERLSAVKISLRLAEEALVDFLRTNRQFATSPELSVARDRLQRDVALLQQVVTVLAQAVEEARIREVRDIPVITVVERPVLAAQADARGRLQALFVGTVVSLAVGVLVVLLREMIARLSVPGTNPAFDSLLAEWRRMRAGER